MSISSASASDMSGRVADTGIRYSDRSGTCDTVCLIIRAPNWLDNDGQLHEAQMSDTIIIQRGLDQQGISWVSTGSQKDDVTKKQVPKGWKNIKELRESADSYQERSDEVDPLVSRVNTAWEKVKSMNPSHVVAILYGAGWSREQQGASDDDDLWNHYINLSSPGHRRLNYPAEDFYNLLARHQGDLTVLMSSCHANDGIQAWSAAMNARRSRSFIDSGAARPPYSSIVMPCGVNGLVPVEHARQVLEGLPTRAPSLCDPVGLTSYLAHEHNRALEPIVLTDIPHKLLQEN